MKRFCLTLVCKALFFLVLFTETQSINAQTYTMGPEEYMSWDDFIANYFDEIDMTIEEKKNGQWQSEILEILHTLHHNPININTAAREDFLRIPFLSEAQTDSIISYRNRKRLLRSLGELQWISGIPYTTRCQLSLFAFAGDTLQEKSKATEHFYKGKHEIITRMDLPLYKREGDKKFSEEDLTNHPSRYYLGHKTANTTRYRYRWKKDVAYGITLQKDAGEPFAAYHNYPFDYTSFYFYSRSHSHRYAIWIGDYNLNMGEGLLLSNNFFYGTLQLIENNIPNSNNIRPHTSSDEVNFFRGAASTLHINKNWQASVFASSKKLDGNIKNDTLISFKTDGLHRTVTEITNRRTSRNTVLGACLSYNNNQMDIGTNVYWSHFQKYIAPPRRSYNKYYLRGKHAAGMSLDYAWKNRIWKIHGETAMDRHFHFATSNTIQYKYNNNSCFVLQQRSFSQKFVSPFGNTIQEHSKIQNEHGVILGTSLRPFNKFNLTSYVNYFYHPYPVYRASQPSMGLEFYLQGKYAISRHIYFTLRYKMKTEKQDITEHKNIMQYVSSHRNRITANYSSPSISLNIAADLAIATQQTSESTLGWMLSTRNHFRIGKQLSIHAFGAVFFTDDYASRLYAYEPQLQYAASFPTFAYHGIRMVGLIQWKFCKKGYVAMRHGWIRYFNRNHIGSGTQQINSSAKNDLSIQLGWHF